MLDNPAGGAGLAIGVGKKATKNHLDLTALKRQVRPGNSKELLMKRGPWYRRQPTGLQAGHRIYFKEFVFGVSKIFLYC